MGLLVCVAGPSQAGKSTLISRFIKEFPHQAVRLPTATSRPARPGEIHGVDKFFLSAEEFSRTDRFLEQVVEHGNHYGTLKDVFVDYIARYPVVLMDIDIRGMRAILSRTDLLPERVLSIFVTPERFEEIQERILKRGDANAQQRIESARAEWLLKDDVLFSVVISTSCSVDASYALFREAIVRRMI